MAVDTMVMLDLLQEAGQEAVTLDELGVAGVQEPAKALLELELLGLEIQRVLVRGDHAERASSAAGWHRRSPSSRRWSWPRSRRARSRSSRRTRARRGSCCSPCWWRSSRWSCVAPDPPATLRRAVQNVHAMRPEVRARHAHALTRIHGDDAFLRRFERFFTELHDPLHAVYGDDRRFAAAWDALLDLIADSAAARDRSCGAGPRARDHPGLAAPGADGGLRRVRRPLRRDAAGRPRAPRYLRELGVTYLHLMPLLRTRPEPNDGGYAVTDYGAVEPSLGTIDDLRELAAELRAAGMALCVDVVLNHTAREHPWAVAARQGDAGGLAFYLTFADRTEPDAYERTLPEVFPETAPGNFTFDADLGRWVWTTFNAYQWDLDHANPEVFVAMAAAMLDLAAVGVDVLRLDAVPFLWKRMGTDCQNQPEVHDLLQAYRAVMRIAAPAVAFKAEAIVAPRELVAYLGLGRHQGMECDLAYHNVLMVLLWSTLATRRVALLGADARGDAAGARRRRMADLRPLPRRHRLGDHRRGRRRGGGGRAPAPAVPHRVLCGRLPRLVRARREVPARAERRGADQRDGSVARRPRARAGAGGRAGRRARAAAAARRVRGGVRVRRAPARLHGRRARAAQRSRLGRGPRARGRHAVDAPPADGLGGRRAPHGPAHAGGRDVGGAATARRGAPGPGGRCTDRASHGRSRRETRTSWAS